MKQAMAKKIQQLQTSETIEGVKVGRIAKIIDGQPFVDFAGNSRGPLAARVTSSVKLSMLREAVSNEKEVLLAFERNDPTLPIIVDTLFSLLDEIAEPLTVSTHKEANEPVTVDGKELFFNAEEQIELRCGKASIKINKDGLIVLRGVKLVSRASKSNKIKGATVHIN